MSAQRKSHAPSSPVCLLPAGPRARVTATTSDARCAHARRQAAEKARGTSGGPRESVPAAIAILTRARASVARAFSAPASLHLHAWDPNMDPNAPGLRGCSNMSARSCRRFNKSGPGRDARRQASAGEVRDGHVLNPSAAEIRFQCRSRATRPVNDRSPLLESPARRKKFVRPSDWAKNTGGARPWHRQTLPGGTSTARLMHRVPAPETTQKENAGRPRGFHKSQLHRRPALLVKRAFIFFV